MPAPNGLELRGEGSCKEKGAARRTEPPLWGGAQRNEDRHPLQVASRKIPPRCQEMFFFPLERGEMLQKPGEAVGPVSSMKFRPSLVPP